MSKYDLKKIKFINDSALVVIEKNVPMRGLDEKQDVIHIIDLEKPTEANLSRLREVVRELVANV